jgi:site-specific recombinase XerD
MGTDITSIQKLLGHNGLKTTMIYTHISKKEIENIISSLDHLLKNKQP